MRTLSKIYFPIKKIGKKKLELDRNPKYTPKADSFFCLFCFVFIILFSNLVKPNIHVDDDMEKFPDIPTKIPIKFSRTRSQILTINQIN